MQERLLAEILGDVTGPDATATLTQGWTQGRATFGGLVAALLARGMMTSLDEVKTLRSLMVSFVGPAPVGAVGVRSEVLREGRNVTQATARLLDGDKVCAQAMAAFGSDRDTKAVRVNPEFKPEPRDSVPPMDSSVRLLPAFLKHFDVHWTGGGIPASNQQSRRLGKWVRHNSDVSAFPTEALIAIADIPPPVMMSHYNRPVMASSLSWSLEFLVAPETVKPGWFYLDYTLEAAANGYSQQSGRVFSEDGELLTLSRQCMVYFE
ncbi:thioesterase family protein [Kordiimonas aestuarii]|uniref:thioesterase family protein n=1 Tax=Kordiimonas aestuarii TaxID=1005925 RepID=UPI0021D36600|nr:thioesterase family protein [Kordiimonas aestuarii]